MNPLDIEIILASGDILAFAEKASTPELTDQQVSHFINEGRLRKDETPKPMCLAAIKMIKSSLGPDSKIEDDKSTVSNDEIDSIDLSKSCLSEEQKNSFRNMLRRNRNSLAFTAKELGECTVAPMSIKIDEKAGIANTRPYRYSPQKMEIIEQQVKQLIEK